MLASGGTVTNRIIKTSEKGCGHLANCAIKVKSSGKGGGVSLPKIGNDES